MSRVALVTGAARGIGAATARRLDAEGWSVACLDRGADDPRVPYALGAGEQLDGLAGELHDGLALRADVTDRAGMGEAVVACEAHFGGLDAVIACAAVITGGVPAWELDPALEDAVLDIDLGGVLTTARAGIPALLRRPQPRSGRFLAVASAASTRGLPMLAAYCAAKSGVAGFVRALAVELRDSGVTANAVAPGSTDTDMLAESARIYGLPDTAQFTESQPIGRLIMPEEIAAMLVWLAGEGAGAVNGALVPVDGGFIA